MDAPHFVLIHAPLVGPLTWASVADRLRRQGFSVHLPRLDSARADVPYWQQHAESAASAVTAPPGAPLVLVAHSGAGPLLPAVQQRLSHPAAALIFVDALLPEDGLSRLDQFEDAAAVEAFRASAQDGLLPVWTEEDLRPVIGDDALRRAFAAELRPLPLAVYEEPIPVYPGWPGVPAAYLRFGDNPAYDRSYARAAEAGFLLEILPGKHFHMLENPPQVVQALVDLARRLGIVLPSEGPHA